MTEINKIKEDFNIVDVIGRQQELKKTGSNYKGICPFHGDNEPSLIVSEKKQKFSCFACGTYGDMIDYFTHQGEDIPNALKIITNDQEIKLTPEQKKTAKKKIENNTWKHILSAQTSCLDFSHYIHGQPNKVWIYKSKSGGINGYVCRFDLSNGSKEVLPMVYAENNGVQKWRYMGMQKPRPLYAEDLIVNNPDAQIIVVEGEKTADAVQEQFSPDKFVVTTWCGGANGLNHTDFALLDGRDIILWPDNDLKSKHKNGDIKKWYEQPGMQAMLSIGDKINTEFNIKIIPLIESLPHKWDAADKDWKSKEMYIFLKENLTDFNVLFAKYLQEKESNNIIKSKELEAPKEEKKEDDIRTKIQENSFFRYLGYTKEEGKLKYSFYSFLSKTVIELSPSSINSANLKMLAPSNYWEKNYPGNKSKIDTSAAQEALMQTSHKYVGPYKDDNIRGRGAWIDENEIVIHNGDSLIVNNSRINLEDFQSKYVYEIGMNLGFKVSDKKLDKTERNQLLESLKFIQWERNINAYFLAGWCVIAPFCGLLDWRPHVWITGPSGTGKSWVMDNVMKRLLGKSAVIVQGNTTEAGLRGVMQSDAIPILFDESEVESQQDRERVQNVIKLARSASYKDGGVIMKGSQSGESKTYQAKSCFGMSSISVELQQRADISRFTVLGLNKFEDTQNKKSWNDFVLKWDKIIDRDYVERLQSRTIRLLPVIIKNAKTFSNAAIDIVGNKRIGDQIGTMIAGAYSLYNSSEITHEKALEWLKDKDLKEEISAEQTKDEYKLFSIIMTHQITVDSERGKIIRNIGELITIAANLKSDLEVNISIADKTLRRFGILVFRDKDKFTISNNSSEISKCLRNHQFSTNHNRILKRLDIFDAESTESREYTPGNKQRGVTMTITKALSSHTEVIENILD